MSPDVSNPVEIVTASNSLRVERDDDATIAEMDGDTPMQAATQVERRLTYDDFLLFPDDGLRHELINGVHYVSASPNTQHQRLVGRLHLHLANYVRQNPSIGEVILGPFDIVLSPFDVVEPDLLFVADHQRGIITDKNASGPPALVIEVLSPSTRRRDEGLKHRLFDETQVQEYWIVDPTCDAVKVHRRDQSGRLRLIARLGDDQLNTPLLPGFGVSLSELFR